MWHELVLCGVGGRTIAEAKERMPYAEFLQWIQYRNRRGTLNIGFRVEQRTAVIAAMYANAHRSASTNAYTADDFTPHADVVEVTLEEAMANW
jgi:hypothetical protein